MDTSETYIKMCEKAEEIQKVIVLDDVLHSWWYDYDRRFIFAVHGNHDISVWEPDALDYLIWLPRQDQLQDMADCHLLFELTKLFESFCYLLPWGQSPHQSGGRFYGMRYTSMEQLWLAFVMKEKYNKIWDGEIWR